MAPIHVVGPKLPPIGYVLKDEVKDEVEWDGEISSAEDSAIPEYFPLTPDLNTKKGGDPSLMDSSPLVSNLHDQEKNGEEGAREISSEGALVTLELFPLTPDLNTKEVPLKRKSMASLTDAETVNVEKKAKYNRTQKRKKEASGCDTELVPHVDPYKVEKKLTKSDVNSKASRLVIPLHSVERYLLPLMIPETRKEAESSKGADVTVRDADRGTEHLLAFGRPGGGSFVIKGGWFRKVAKPRLFKAGDVVGIYWDSSDRKFHFKLVRKAN